MEHGSIKFHLSKEQARKIQALRTLLIGNANDLSALLVDLKKVTNNEPLTSEVISDVVDTLRQWSSLSLREPENICVYNKAVALSFTLDASDLFRSIVATLEHVTRDISLYPDERDARARVGLSHLAGSTTDYYEEVSEGFHRLVEVLDLAFGTEMKWLDDFLAPLPLELA